MQTGPIVAPARCRRGQHILIGTHLRLQTPTIGDHHIMYAAASDSQAQRWLGWPPEFVVAPDDIDRLLALEPGDGQCVRNPPQHWLLAIDQSSGMVAGGIALDRRSREVGGFLAPAFRGQGLGCELFAAIATLAHEHLGIASIRAGTESANAASVGALLAAGFSPAHGPDLHQLPDGRQVPSTWFQHNAGHTARCRPSRLL